MTDENLMNAEQPQGMSVNSGIDSVGGDFGSQTPSATQKEEYVPKSRVNEIIHAEKRRAYEKGLQEAAQRSQPQQQQSSTDNAQSFNEERIRNLIKQEAEALEKKRFEDAQRLQQQQEAQRLYTELGAKLEAKRKANPAIDDKLAKVNYFNDMPGLQYALNQFDNAGDLMEHLVENKRDAVIIDSLAKIRDKNGHYTPDAAVDELRRISERLKQNEAAKSAPVPPSPISQIETTVRDGVRVSGENSLKDFKRMFRT